MDLGKPCSACGERRINRSCERCRQRADVAIDVPEAWLRFAQEEDRRRSWKETRMDEARLGGSPIDLALVGCGKAKKVEGEWPAHELYTGTLFRLAYTHARLRHEDTLILSALHGAIPPTQMLYPYDFSTVKMHRTEHAEWGQRVVGELLCLYPLTRLSITFLCGYRYIWPILEAFKKDHPPWDFTMPLEGLDLFGRLRWFRQQESSHAIS